MTGESDTAPAHRAGAEHDDKSLEPSGQGAYWILVWLSKLRWGAIVGQLATIVLVHTVMAIELPLAPLLFIVALEAASNLAVVLWLRREPEVREWSLGALMAFDVVALTGLLYLTGGPFNPFSFLYLVHIALAAAVLRDRWTWGLVALSLACFGALFFHHVWLDLEHGTTHSDHMRMHLEGMWVAFGVAAGFIAYFVSRVRRELARKDRDLMQARELAGKTERLASLTTLAAGAAHELSTPLGTIAVASTELELEFRERIQGEPELLADVRLIRHEVDRCREILDQMAAQAGESAGERLAPATVGALLDQAREGLPEPETLAIHGDPDALEAEVFVPLHGVVQAIRAILKNAQEAAPEGDPVRIEARASGERIELRITDRGSGMTPSTLARVHEPFFTTKEAGRGMGLGVFLARTVLSGLGGDLRFSSELGEGTTATLFIPRECGNPPPSAASRDAP